MTIIQTSSTFNTNAIKPFEPRPYLMGSFDLSVHTNLAQRLCSGSWTHGKLGLIQFSQSVSLMRKAYREDDPYAEWYLLRIYKAIQEAKDKTKEQENILQEQMQSLRGFKVTLFTNPTPFEQSLKLTSAFVFLGAMMVEHIDYVARQLFTLMRMGLKPNEEVTPTTLYRLARRVFSIARDWHYTGVTRTDIRDNNQKAQKALEIFKEEVPAAVFNQEIEFAYFPKMRREEHAQQQSTS